MRWTWGVRRCAASFAGLVAAPVLVCVGAATTAKAQLDINIESRIETLTPPPSAELPSVPETRVIRTLETRERSSEEINRLLADKVGPARLQALTASEKKTEADRLGLRFKKVVVEKTVTEPRKTKFRLSFWPALNYDSNAFRSPSNARDDLVSGFGSAFRAAIPVGDGLDQVVLGAGTNSIRYGQFSSRDFDLLSGSAAYQMISRHYVDPRYKSQYTTTFDQLDFTIANSTTFAPFFKRETIYFVTPSVGWSRQNIPLSDAVYDAAPGSAAFRHYADISVRLGHSFTDSTTLENTNLNATGTVGLRLPENGLTFSATGSATGRWYPDFPGGREDLLLIVGPRVDYAAGNVGVAIWFNYNRQYSSVAAARYEALVAASQFTLAFSWP